MPLYLTVYPDPHPETTSVDGYAGRHNQTELFADLRSGAGTIFDDATTNTATCQLVSSWSTGKWETLRRGIYLFDTSALGGTVTISDAVFSLWGFNKTDNFSQSVCVGSAVPTTGNTALVNADYNIANWGAADFANRITFTDWSITGYNAFTLNATGLAAIAKTGITKFGIRPSADMDNSAPTWANSVTARVYPYAADWTGTDKDPKLYITYTAGGTAHTGAAAITLAITTAAAGKKALYGAAVATLAITTAAAGKKALTGAATALLSITTAGAGLRALYGAASATLSLTTAASGLKTLLGAATATLTLTTAAAGLKTLHGAGTALLELFTSGAGKKALYGAGTALLTLTASAALEVASLLPYAPTILEVFLPHNELIAIIETNTVEVTMQRTTLQVI